MYRGGAELAGDGSPWPGEAQTLLLQAVVGPPDGVRDAFERWKALTDIEAPVDGGTYRLLPLLYTRLTALGFDDPLLGRLKGVYRRGWYANNLLFHRVAPAVAALEAAGIRTMVMKGVPIALGCYASHAARPMADLDVVVRSADMAAAQRILTELGWRAGSTHPEHEAPDQHAQDFHGPEGAEIDLHRHCLREAPSDAVDDWFWSDAQPLTFAGVTSVQPGPTQMLTHTVLHGLRSNLEPPIRWISDAAAILERHGGSIDWDGLVVFARAHHLCHRMALGLRHLVETFGQPVPERVIDQLEAAGVSLIERVENIVYLGPARRMYQPYLFPLVDYWRFRRVRHRGEFWRRLPAYLTRRWRLRHPMMIPVAVVSSLLRRRPA